MAQKFTDLIREIVDKGANWKSIDSITKSGDTVTITYDSGSPSSFTIKDGIDGVAGRGVDKIERVGNSVVITYTDSSSDSFTIKEIANIQKSGTNVLVTYNDSTTNSFFVADGAKGDTGKDGNRWIVGSVAPTSVGKESDIYLNSTSFLVYEKSGGVWNQIGSIKGESGVSISGVTQAHSSVPFVDRYEIGYSDGAKSYFEIPQPKSYKDVIRKDVDGYISLLFEHDDPLKDRTIGIGRLGASAEVSKLISRYILKKSAGEDIVAKDICVVIGGEVFKADSSNQTHFNKQKVIATTSSVVGQEVEIITSGRVWFVGWGLVHSTQYFLGLNGSITNIRPTSGFVQRVGYAVASDKLMFEVEPAIKL